MNLLETTSAAPSRPLNLNALRHLVWLGALLSACTADPANQESNQAATQAAPEVAPTGGATDGAAAPAGTSAADEPAPDPAAGVQPEEPCQVLPAAEVAQALGVAGPLEPVRNQNDVTSKCLYQSSGTTLLALEWTRDVASQRAYASNKAGLAQLNMTPELVPDLNTEAFWGIDSELYAQLPGGMLTVRAAGNTPTEQRARALQVAKLVLNRR